MNKQTKQRTSSAPAAVNDGSATKNQNVFIAVTLVYTAVGLTVLEYFGKPWFADAAFPKLHESFNGLYLHLWWAAWSIIVYLPLPMLIVKYGFKHSLREYGLSLKLNRRDLLLYAAMLLTVLPIVFFVSRQDGFLAIYPFYRGAPQAAIEAVMAWEVAYLLQFVALEFFFRGFLVLGLQRYFGHNAVWIAVVPYCMIHYHKPPVEAFAAIVAGLILGEVALRTRSILGGVLVHIGVALSMDMLAIRHFYSITN